MLKEEVVKLLNTNFFSYLDEKTRKLLAEIASNPMYFNEIKKDKEAIKYLRKVTKIPKELSFNDLRLLLSGAWLEKSNTQVLDSKGNLLVQINKRGGVSVKKLNESTEAAKQSILRQIERWYTLKTQGLLKPIPGTQNILDIGAGPLICSTILRKIYPKSSITALEPGLISDKTRHIAKSKRIEVIRKRIEKYKTSQKFQLILLHFVLEHCNKAQTKKILRIALDLLDKEGTLSIVVPNKDAFHRKLESKTKLGRELVSMLSPEDRVCGHKFHFPINKISQIIKQITKREDLKVYSQTILPRPLSFKYLSLLSEHKSLAKLQELGHIKGLENEGSVTCILISSKIKPYLMSNKNSKETKQEFIRLLKKLTRQNVDKTLFTKVRKYLKKCYSNVDFQL